MSLTLTKVRGSDSFQFNWNDGSKSVSWTVDGSNVDPTTLLDIVDTAAPDKVLSLPPTTPAIPLDWPRGQVAGIFVPDTSNQGAEAADQAAREEEMRLRNMGSALGNGVGLGPMDIPVVDSDRNDLPEPNWGV